MMNGMHKWLWVLSAVLLATFAVPGFGATQKSKMYHLATTSNAPTQITISLTNVSVGSGNSTITAFQLVFAGVAIDELNPIDPNPANRKAPTVTNQIVGGVQIATITLPLIATLKVGAPAYELTIHLKDCGGQLTGATVWTSIGGQTFAPDFDSSQSGTFTVPLLTNVTCGQIACGGNTPVPSSTYVATVTRGGYDKDGVTTIAAGQCTTVPYTVTKFDNILLGEKQLFWPTDLSGDDAAAFQLTINNPAITQVGWLPTTGNAVLIKGPLCLSQPTLPGTDAVLPAPYGKLLADVDVNGYIEVNTLTAVVIRPAAFTSFDIVGGTGGERLTVHFDNTAGLLLDGVGPNGGELWKVDARNVGGTPLGGPFTPTTLVPTDLMMYTPLPLLPGVDPADGVTPLNAPAAKYSPLGPYVVGNQAQMCIVKHDTGAGTTTLMDIGDGFHAP